MAFIRTFKKRPFFVHKVYKTHPILTTFVKTFYMADIRLSIDKEFIERLKKETGIDKASQLTNEALTFYKWAVSEAKEGRVLLSTNSEGGDVKKIVIPTLERAREISKS